MPVHDATKPEHAAMTAATPTESNVRVLWYRQMKERLDEELEAQLAWERYVDARGDADVPLS